MTVERAVEIVAICHLVHIAASQNRLRLRISNRQFYCSSMDSGSARSRAFFVKRASFLLLNRFSEADAGRLSGARSSTPCDT